MTTDTVPPVFALRGVSLAELAEFPPDLIKRSLGNVIPDEAADPVPVAAFQSSI